MVVVTVVIEVIEVIAAATATAMEAVDLAEGKFGYLILISSLIFESQGCATAGTRVPPQYTLVGWKTCFLRLNQQYSLLSIGGSQMLTLLCIAVADSAVDTEDSEVVVVVATAAAAAAVVTEWATSVLVCKDKNGVRLSLVFSPIF